MTNTNKLNFLSILLMLLLYSQASQAEDIEVQAAAPPLSIAQLPSEDDYLGDVPQVLTVSRLSQSLADAPSAVTVLDRETIRASGAVDIPELFRLIPGMYVATNAGFSFNTNHVVSYHGMATAYPGTMQILINGRSVYSPLFGGVNWSELPIAVADIERIEVTRGPNAASYGANAFSGTVNIITQSPSEQAGASISATYGNGRREAFAKYASKFDDFKYRITAGYRDDDGLQNRLDFKRTRILNAQADYRVSDKNSVELEFGIADGNREEGTAQDPLLFKGRTKDISNHFELIRWRHNLSETGDFSLQAFHSVDRSDDIFAADLTASPVPLLDRRPIINNDVEFERYDIEAQHNFSLVPTLRGVWGGSIRRDKMYAPFYLGNSQTDKFDLQRLFGHAEWSPSQYVVVNAGAMLEHNDFTGSDVSPRASINFKINPNHTIRFGLSTALRTPNYLEEKFNAGIAFPTTNPRRTFLRQYFADVGNLKPEKIISKEIGYLGTFGQLSLDARLFRDNISDSIQVKRRDNYVPPPGLTLIKNNNGTLNPLFGINGGEISVQGFEAQAKWHIASDSNVLLNYAYVNIDADPLQTDSGTNDSMPKDTISALFTHSFSPQWDASYAYYHTSAVTALGDGNPVKLARRSDVRLARKFNATHVNGEVSMVVENLFNEHYQEFATYNTLKRRARINVRLDF
jgi:iron complex outermembrane recepter protein